MAIKATRFLYNIFRIYNLEGDGLHLLLLFPSRAFLLLDTPPLHTYGG